MDNGACSYHRFLSGDESGLEEIVELYNRSLICFLNGYVANLAIAEELAADTFLELIVKKPHFNQDSTFKTYLFKIGRNNALDYLRHQARHQTSPLDELELADLNELEAELIKSEEHRQIRDVLDTLHPDYRDVLHLLYFEDMSYDEAAAVLKKSRKQVNNLAYRAKKALKTALDKGVAWS